ncbi:zinc finger protein 830 [Scaptodrosophila lebanonensis]|uniref:Zinc finger protein 830 n=1 Tax=Drosophila lebanonensis TaxID=7225 RepID=A0A6J2TV24_DROLE|nr:zinc finger protein 830 [Scaptodrosophila lebanonensis]
MERSNAISIKLRRQSQIASTKKVDSPIAKYDSGGNLTCIICRIPIKSATVWKIHINSKHHKESIKFAKQEHCELFNKQTIKESKPILLHKNARLKPKSDIINNSFLETNGSPLEVIGSVAPAQILPEQFFDKQTASAIPDCIQDEEWSRFQREIKDADTVSNIIIAEEQQNFNIKRQIKEIDEQIENWNRFIKLNYKQNLLKKHNRKVYDNIEPSSSEEDGIEETLSNWRVKNLQK